ncbi:unnamed protein product [Caenorhabditis angaria]|uniref:Uncharacterized protein n=1 Tax=Caenorhabditis angaria TaxID=860376 RepID=A0A9P1I925_9PELO|nr:unnamed protein product [Caenorhabditis angaria]
MFRLVLTLCCLALSAVNSTRFTAEQAFSCTIQKNWQFSLVFWEEDSWTPNEILHQSGTINVQNIMVYNLVSIFNYDEGDGKMDLSYEIFMTVYHNCTSNGAHVSKQYFLGHVGIHNKEKLFEAWTQRYNLDNKY